MKRRIALLLTIGAAFTARAEDFCWSQYGGVVARQKPDARRIRPAAALPASRTGTGT
jgi:hypothetical protein